MVKSGKRMGIGMAAALLLASITTGARAQAVPGGAVSSFGGEFRRITKFTGKVVCVGCSLQEVQKAHPDQHDFYLLSHRKGQVVMAVDTVSEPQVMSYFAFPPRIAVRAKDEIFEKLTAEENLFRQIEIIGLLRGDAKLSHAAPLSHFRAGDDYLPSDQDLRLWYRPGSPRPLWGY